MKVSAVLVHYRTPGLAARAVESLRREAAACGADLEILLVDNGSDAAGRAELADLPARLLDPGDNLGYAGGLNLGVSQAVGDVLILANPDLELLPGSLDRLLETLHEAARADGAAVVGPRFLWDREGRFLLPPAERRDRISDLLARRAPRSESWAARARRRWRRHARHHWLATQAVPSVELSGALLAVTRTAWKAAGPFDAGFRLYFEETDWLLRAAGRGIPILHEPRASVLHHYNRSAADEDRAAAWFAASEQRFSRRWYGPLHRALRRALAPAGDFLAPPPHRLPPGRPQLDLAAAGLGGSPSASPGRGQSRPREGTWVELSPLSRGFPAAGQALAAGETRWELPREVWGDLDRGTWTVTVADRAGRELLRVRFDVPATAGDREGAVAAVGTETSRSAAFPAERRNGHRQDGGGDAS